ncbi:MAG: hypothetical protein LJE68_08430 [Rhodobacter sp.]|nr:hypothetical protein [Rhodobacter sp.]
MKNLAFLSLLATAHLAFSGPVAAGPAGAPSLASEPVVQQGLSWRCGKNNPAMWGTFGNGCLKQKRAHKNGTAELVVPANPGVLTLQGGN